MKKALKSTQSAEVRRRIEYLMEHMQSSGESGERLKQTRALEVLEAMGTPAARALLDELAKGAADAWVTREAKATLERLGK